MSDVYKATKNKIKVNENTDVYKATKQAQVVDENAYKSVVSNQIQQDIAGKINHRFTPNFSKTNVTKTIVETKKPELKTTIPSKSYDESYVKELQLKNNMNAAKREYEETKANDDRNILVKFLQMGSDLSPVYYTKTRYDKAKKDYEDFKSAKYYSSLPNGTVKSTNPDKDFFKANDSIDMKYEYINDINNARNFVRTTSSATGSKNAYKIYDNMTDREIGIYNYLYETEGKNKAEEFLKFLETDLDALLNQDVAKFNKQFAEKFPILSSAASVAGTFASVGEQLKNYGEYLATGNMKTNKMATATSTIRDTVSKKVDVEIGEWDAFDFVYNTVMSGVDSFAAAQLGPLGAVALGLSAAGSTTNDILARGGDSSQAFWGGAAAGVFEGFFEKFSIGQLNSMQEGAVKGFKDYAYNLVKSMGVNFTEEAATEVANILYDYAINGGISNYSIMVQEFVDSGDSLEVAKKKAAQQLGLQVLEAGASGALMGFGFASISSVASYKNASSIGKMIAANESESEVLNAALSMNSNTESYKMASEIKNSGEITTAKMGGLVSQIMSDISNQKSAAIETAVSERAKELGVDSKTAQKLTSYLTKAATNGKIESIEADDVSKNTQAQQIINEIKNNESWAENLNTQLSSLEKTEQTVRNAITLNTPETVVQSTPTSESEVESEVVRQSENILQGDYESDIISNNQDTGVDIDVEQQDGDSNQRIGREVFSSESQTGAIQETDGRVYDTPSRSNRGTQSALRNQRNNRRIEPTAEQKESLKTTAIKGESGDPKIVHHFTDNMEFEVFGKGDVGFHFGNENQANQHKTNLKNKGKLKGEGRIIQAYLDIKNPVRVSSDIMCWWPAHTALRLFADGVIDFEQYLSVYNLQVESGHNYDSPAAVELRKMLDNLGYDGVVYQNNDFFEGEGESYIAFYPEQVIIVDDGRINNEADTQVPANFMPEDNKQKQLDVILETNPAPNTYQTWVRSVDDIKTLAETLEDSDWQDEDINPDLTRTDIQNAVDSGKIMVYSSYPIKNGVFVSPSRMEAESYSGNGKVYEKEVDINDVAWIDPTQGQYAEVKNADVDQEVTNNDMYSKDPSQWSAESKNDTSVSKTFKEKLANLFGKNTDKKATSISEIVKLIEKDFEVPISKGKFRQRAYGIYKNKAQAIRTKVSNALPTIAHELGHHLDNKYHLRNFESIGEAERVLKETRPDFYNSYKPMARPREAVAEFMRDYLADRNLAKEKYPFFFEEFERKLSQGGNEAKNDLENLKIIGNKINEYYTAELSERAKAAILTRKEAKKVNRMGADLEGILTRVETETLDDAAIFKKISQKAYDLYYWAKKSNVRAKNTLSGYYMSGFKKDLVPARDKDGKIVKDSQGKITYVPALKFVLSELENNEMVRDFEEYLVMRHGIEWLDNDLRVFADDALNNKKYMQQRIKELENQYSQFKDISENLYEWYRTFVYEYGVESGLMTKEQYQSLIEKYPCYVPFMRNVESKRGFGKSGLGNQNAPIKRAKGSGLEILSPIESIVIKIEQFMKAADRNAVMKEITETADEEGGFGWLLEEVPPDMIPKTLSSDVIKNKAKKTLVDSGFDESAADDFSHLIDTLIGESITDFQIGTIQGENVVAVRKDGKRKLYQIHDKNLLAALVGLQPNQFDIITKAMGKITKVFKALTTGSNAVWSLVSNMPRDFDSAYKYGSENNPIKYTVDYIKAVASQISGKESEAFKLYRTMGGGYNNSFANAKELQITTKELFKQNENLADKIKSLFNIVEDITKLADFVETAPRLAEFKRVYERTGDAKKAMLAAEEVTVNFNRSGKFSKVLDQYLPYFNASLQANAKYAKTIAGAFSKNGDKSFLVKSIVTSLIKLGITFGVLGLFGDEGEDEYEKLSAYKKNNFYNIYLGDGKFSSIPKSQATGMFDSLLERVFEIARKEDVEWAQEVKDFADYMWLTFGPPMFDDIMVVGTALELASNEDFTGAPIVSSYYKDLVPEMQYNERTTYIAKFVGQLLGWSPMKIDHVIESNLGVFGLINKSIGKKEKDWTLGTKTKVITDSAYSTDVLNNFYEKAEDYYSKAKSYPDNAEYVYKDKQYSAIKSIVSALNDYGREDPAVAREFKVLARNYVDNFEKKSAVNEKLFELLKRSKNDEILYDRTFKPTYTLNKVEYKMEPEEYLELVDNYYKEVELEYNEIFKMNLSDETTIRLLNNAKKNVYEKVSKKYKIKRK